MSAIGRRQLCLRVVVPIFRTTNGKNVAPVTISCCRQLSTSNRKKPNKHQRQSSNRQQDSYPTAKVITKRRNNVNNSTHNNNNNHWKRTRQECRDFLRRHHQQEYPPRGGGLAAQKVKELLVQLLNCPTTSNRQNSAEKGPLASQLLQVALKDLKSNDVQDDINNNPQRRHNNEVRAKLYQMTIEAWVHATGTGSSEAFANAETLLWEVLSNPQDFYGSSVANNVDNINTAFASFVFAICKAEQRQPILSRKSQERLEPIIQTIQKHWKDSEVPLLPDSVSMDAILYYYFKLQQPDRAYRILQEEILLPQNKNSNNPFLTPTLHGLNTVISAFAKQGNVAKARELIELMLAEESIISSQPNNNSPRMMPSPNVVSFNSLLDAIAKQGDATAGSQAEQVLEWMEDLAIYPNTISYTTAISAWGKSQDPRAAEKAEGILKHMVELAVSGTRNLDVAPNEFTISSVIHAWAVSGRSDALERAVANLERIQTFYQDQDLPPDKLISVYNSLMMAIAKSKHPNATDEVLKLLSQMEQIGIRPDSRTHNTIMSITMKTEPNGPSDALEYFLNLETRYLSGDSSVQIDTYSYNVALAAIAKLRDRKQAPSLALDLLKRMMDNSASNNHSTNNHNTNNMEPDTTTYNTVMKILAKSPLEDSAIRTEELLRELEGDSDSSSIQKNKPSVISYSTCISAWGYSRSPDRFDRMRELLLRMEAFYTSAQNHRYNNRSSNNGPLDKPNVVPFNTVFIGCCCSSLEERETALSCVLETVDHMRRMSIIKANDKTYPVLLRAIGLNTKPGERRDALLSEELDHCIQEGLVNGEVVRALKDASMQVLLSKLPAAADSRKDIVSFNTIPKEWKRNLGRVRS